MTEAWRPMNTAPKDGTRILCWCNAAESPSGIQEMYWCSRYNTWRSVITHPFENACPDPVGWLPTIGAPK